MQESNKDKKTGQDPGQPQGDKNRDDKNNKRPRFSIYWIYGLIAVTFIAIQLFSVGNEPHETNFREFRRDMVAKHHVDRVVVANQEEARVYLTDEAIESGEYDHIFDEGISSAPREGPHFQFNIGSVEIFEQRMEEAQEGFDEDQEIVISYVTERDVFGDMLGWMIPIFIIIAIWIFIFRRMSGAGGGGGPGGIFNVGKSKAKMFDKESNVKVDFKDVAGLEEAKMEVKEVVDFLKKPSKYTELGGKIPKGVLLVGPAGTGKTLLAKAVAGEANVPFFSISGSEFVEMFVGVGASRVRDLFKQAKEKAPCIVFIDEIDAVGRARGKSPGIGGGANDERENTLNQLLSEMDGFEANMGVIVLAATNRVDVLDRALLRAGRFDRQIQIELPDLNERKDIFSVHLKPLKVEKSLEIEFLAKQTPGFSGADIANACNEAALIAARKDKKIVGRQDFLDAIDRIIAGLERKNKVITTSEKRTIAYHESGHATVSWFMEFANPMVKVTIVPRGKALGAAWYLPEERQITTKEQLFDEMCVSLGGRASEELNFGKVSTGALNDLERVTKQAYAMVTYFGMSPKIGNISFYDSTGQNEYSFTKPYSEKTAEVIDKEVTNLIQSAYNRAKEILKNKEKGLVQLAELLLEKEVIFTEDLEKIFGERNFGTDEEKVPLKRESQDNDSNIKPEQKDKAWKDKKEAGTGEEKPENSKDNKDNKDNKESKKKTKGEGKEEESQSISKNSRE